MFILASSSPRRKELLKRLVSNFTVIVPKINENIKVAEKEYLPLEISKLKAYAILSLYPEDTVLASDTIVIYENEVLGKPKNIEDARRMLHLLSGKKHQVITAYTLISPKKKYTAKSQPMYILIIYQNNSLKIISRLVLV